MLCSPAGGPLSRSASTGCVRCTSNGRPAQGVAALHKSGKAEPSHEHFDVRFAFRALEPKLVGSDEVEGARFVALDEVASVTSDESVLRAVRKLLASGYAR
jgi:hypothetical protein